jgi:hypothetical protein
MKKIKAEFWWRNEYEDGMSETFTFFFSPDTSEDEISVDLDSRLKDWLRDFSDGEEKEYGWKRNE